MSSGGARATSATAGISYRIPAMICKSDKLPPAARAASDPRSKQVESLATRSTFRCKETYGCVCSTRRSRCRETARIKPRFFAQIIDSAFTTTRTIIDIDDVQVDRDLYAAAPARGAESAESISQPGNAGRAKPVRRQ